MTSFYLVEAKAKEGENVPIGLSMTGEVYYCHNGWRGGHWMVRRQDAERFRLMAKNLLTVYPDLTGEFEICHHQVMGDEITQVWKAA